MSKKAKVVMGASLVFAAYLCVGVLGRFAINGTLGIVGIPFVVTVALLLSALGAFQLINAGVVCKPIRFIIYFMSGLAVVCIPVIWIVALNV